VRGSTSSRWIGFSRAGTVGRAGAERDRADEAVRWRHDWAVKALDPRLVRYARATRIFLFASVALGTLQGVAIVAQAWLLADVVARAFLDGAGLGQLRPALTALLVVVCARAALAWASELASSRASTQAKSQLRGALLEHVAALGPQRTAAPAAGEPGTGAIALLASRGVDALDGYFSLYLPQLFLAAIVPVVVIVAVVSEDWISAAIIAVTIPLIPLFMALVGAVTGERNERQLQVLERLSGHFLDVVRGLGTLKVFGRAHAQARAIGEIAESYRSAAMGVLRVTFLSSLILELVATISVALVAVAIGLRLLDGDMGLRAGLFALVLAPEAYLPLRRLGAHYHASAEGMAAAERVFELLERPLPVEGSCTSFPDPGTAEIAIDGLEVVYPDREEPAIEGFSLTIEPGETLAIVGPSGCGKSTLLGVLLGFVAPRSGSVRVGGVDLGEIERGAWREQLAWVAQRPHLFGASVEQNVTLGRAGISREEVWEALAAAGLAERVRALPEDLQSVLGDGGAGLSAGERQRIALARAFVRDAPLLLLDEPTAGLDGRTEEGVVQAIARLAEGRTVVLVAHRPALAAIADRTVAMGSLATIS
jgi:thiol reductant ABC exporter CydD subunit